MSTNIHPTAIISRFAEFRGAAYIGPGSVIGAHSFQHKNWLAAEFSKEDTDKCVVLGDECRVVGLSVICFGTIIGKHFRADYHSLVGENCVIGNNVVIEYGARLYDSIRVGDNTIISGFVCNEAIIGNCCVIQGSLIHKRTSPDKEPAPVIEDGCFIGMNSTVIGGVRIRANSFIAAGAVVTKDTEEGYLYAGVPAKKIGPKNWY